MEMEMYGKKAKQGINWVTTVFMALFHVGAIAALFSIVLVLIHHIHLLMYVPTIITIVVIRHYLTQGVTRTNVAFGAVALLCVSALFFAAQFLGTMPIPEADFVEHLKTRMTDPSRTDLLRVTVVARDAVEAEVTAKALFLAGAEAARREANELAIPAVLVTADGRTITAGALA